MGDLRHEIDLTPACHTCGERVEHGPHMFRKYGCRCEVCNASMKHGAHLYRVYRCRCEVCRFAVNQESIRYRARHPMARRKTLGSRLTRYTGL